MLRSDNCVNYYVYHLEWKDDYLIIIIIFQKVSSKFSTGMHPITYNITHSALIYDFLFIFQICFYLS